MIPLRILGTGSALMGRPITTEELARQALPGKEPVQVRQRIGIDTRYWLEPSTSACELAVAALRRALDAAGLEARELRRIIFVSCTGGDWLLPATVYDVMAALGLSDSCDGFDLNNACTGFITGFDVAARSVATGVSPVAVVVAEPFSRFLSPQEPRSFLVMGDAGAAVVLGPGREGEGMLSSYLRGNDRVRGGVTIEHPAVSGQTPVMRFAVTSDELTDSALQALSASSRAVCQEAGISLAEVEWFLPHQPNGRMLETILSKMEIAPERTVPVVREIGSVGAASVAVSLDRLYRSGRVKPGDRLLMCAVGAGTGYGAVLHRVAP